MRIRTYGVVRGVMQNIRLLDCKNEVWLLPRFNQSRGRVKNLKIMDLVKLRNLYLRN